MKESNANGHYARIVDGLENRIYPSVEFSFTAKHEPNSLISPSKISFIAYGDGNLTIVSEIDTVGGKKLFQKKRFGEVTEQWIEGQLLGFIRDVLDAD